MKKILLILTGMIFSLAAWSQVTVDAGKDTLICGAGNCATIAATATGGAAPYTYSWSPGIGAGAGPHSVCPASTTTYTVTVTDNGGMTATDVVEVNILTISVSFTAANCGACNGSGTATALGGIPSYTYTWSTTPVSTGSENQYLCSGIYTVSVTDNSGCSATTTVNIPDIPPLQANMSTTSVSCNAGNNGTATVFPTGGTMPYTYSWNFGPTTRDVYSLTSGTYIVTVKDNNGCSVTAQAVINQPTAIISTVSNNTVKCGETNGSATVFVTGGTPGYTYFWSNGANTPITTGLMAISYTVTVTDANGCSSIALAPINSTGGPAIKINEEPTVCFKSDGSATVIASEGLPPYTYKWSNGSTNPVITGMPSGAYIITVTGSDGCASAGVAVIPNISGPAITVVNKTNPTCKNWQNGSVSVFASDGTPPYTFTWNTKPVQNGPVATGLITGTYIVIVTDANGCSISRPVYLNSTGDLYLWANSSPETCNGNGTAQAFVYQGTIPYTYTWNTSPPQNSATATGLTAGIYTVTVQDAMGCYRAGEVKIYRSKRNSISGSVYHDKNKNCLRDSSEEGIPYAFLVIKRSGQPWCVQATDQNGNYTLYLDSGSYTIEYDAPANGNRCMYYFSKNRWQSICPASPPTYTFNLSDSSCQLFTQKDFGLLPDTSCVSDLGISNITTGFVPGFISRVYIYPSNKIATLASGKVKLVFDSKLQYVTANPLPDNYDAATRTLEWDIANVLPHNYKNLIEVQLQVPAGIPLGTLLYNSFSIEPVAGDCCPYDNAIDGTYFVRGSFDPNDKAVSPPGIEASGKITVNDSLLYYTIRFQNTGTDTAFKVVIRDTLSPFLDPYSVVSGAASHPYTFDISGSGNMTWTFDNIMLPDSNVNEKASHGFITYAVKQKSGNPVGTAIENTAAIYFDFNEPVITNTTVNTIYDPVGLAEENARTSFVHIYPNPFIDYATVEIPAPGNEPLSFVLYDIPGREVMREDNITRKTFLLNRSNLQTGLYLFKVFSGGKQVGTGKIVIQ